MQPTPPPPPPPWLTLNLGFSRRRMRVMGHYLALARKRDRMRSQFTLYTSYANDPSKILRLGNWNGHANTARPAGGLVGGGGLMGWDRYPALDLTAPAPPPHGLSNLPGRENIEWASPTTAPYTFSKWRGGEAWLGSAALIGIIFLVARATEKCLDRNLHKRRQRAQEWPTPNVQAICNQHTDGTMIIPGLENAEPLPADLNDSVSIDLPPPYSECTTPGGAGVSAPSTSNFEQNKIPSDLLREEPPPPYSDCYVEFSNKNGVPSVLICSRKRSPLVNQLELTSADQSEILYIDDDATVNQNCEEPSLEIANEVTRSDGFNMRDTNDNASNNRTMPGNTTLNHQYGQDNLNINSSEPRVDVNEGENHKNRIVLT